VAGASIAAGAAVDGSLVEAGASVAAGAVVERSLLLSGARVDAGARVSDSIVAGHVAESAEIAGSVIGASYHVPYRASVLDECLPRTAPSHQP
jgi:ADP-glucose pyrophosphorylase